MSSLRWRKFLSNLGVITSSSFFYICFHSLLTHFGRFILYLISVPLRKGYRDLEYKCSFVHLYLFLFAFFIICTKSFGFCLYLFLHFWLFTFKVWVFVDCFVTWPPSFAKTGTQSDIQVSCGCEERQSSKNYLSLSIQSWLNICPNYSYLHKVMCIRIKQKQQQKKWGERKDWD